MKSRNGNMTDNTVVYLFRIFFTTIIMLHHFRGYSPALPFGGGYMATDLFFIMSGFLMVSSAYWEKEGTILKKVGTYALKRYVRLGIPLWVCNAITLGVVCLISDYRLENGLWKYCVENSMIELFTLESGARFNPPTWYLGILLISSVLVFGLFAISERACKRDMIRNCVMWGFVITYFALIWQNGEGNIYVQNHTIFPWKAILRGISGVSVGAIIYDINVPKQKARSVIVELLILGVVYSYFLLWEDGYSRVDVIIYILMAVGFMLCKSEIAFKNQRVSQVIKMCSGSSYYAFLIHYPLIRVMEKYRIWDGMDWKLYSALYVWCIWIMAMLLYEGKNIVIAKRRNINV